MQQVEKMENQAIKMFGNESKIIGQLKIFGQMAIIRYLKSKLTSKINNRGWFGMFFGYSMNH